MFMYRNHLYRVIFPDGSQYLAAHYQGFILVGILTSWCIGQIFVILNFLRSMVKFFIIIDIKNLNVNPASFLSVLDQIPEIFIRKVTFLYVVYLLMLDFAI